MSASVSLKKLDIFLVEMTSGASVEANHETVLSSLQALASMKLGPVGESEPKRLVSFPENSLFFRLRSQDQFPQLSLDSVELKQIAQVAKDLRLNVHLGSIPLTIDGKRMNSTVWISDKGEISSPYQKVHLFDVDVKGIAPIRESDNFHHGSKTKIIELDGWKIGLSICYDLRFAELFLVYRQAGVDLILIPSAFTVPTGRAHWEILLRARAIESQCYVAAAAQAGDHEGARSTYGHSMIIGPWGQILSQRTTEDQPRILGVRLDRSEIEKVRQQIPMASHVRLI